MSSLPHKVASCENVTVHGKGDYRYFREKLTNRYDFDLPIRTTFNVYLLFVGRLNAKAATISGEGNDTSPSPLSRKSHTWWAYRPVTMVAWGHWHDWADCSSPAFHCHTDTENWKSTQAETLYENPRDGGAVILAVVCWVAQSLDTTEADLAASTNSGLHTCSDARMGKTTEENKHATPCLEPCWLLDHYHEFRNTAFWMQRSLKRGDGEKSSLIILQGA